MDADTCHRLSMTEHERDRLLTRKQVEDLTGLSRATIYRRLAAGHFPAPCDIGIGAGKVYRWSERAVQDWIAAARTGNVRAA